MSTPQDDLSQRRQRERHSNVEQQGFALGAERERMRRTAALSREGIKKMEEAIDEWESDGGAIAGGTKASPPLKPSRFRISADLFRDDTFARAAIWNGALLLIAAVSIVLLMNN